MTTRLEPVACPFCGSTSVEVLPKDPESEGNAWGAVQCVNFDCPTYDGVRSHGVRVWDGEDVSDERGSDAYKRAAILRWNRRAAPAPDGMRKAIARVIDPTLHDTTFAPPFADKSRIGLALAAADRVLAIIAKGEGR